jgi:hypothetical protein
MLTLGAAITLGNLALVVFHPGEPSPWDSAREVLRQLLAREEVLKVLFLTLQDLVICGAGIALALAGVIVLSARTAEAEVPAPAGLRSPL